MHSYDYETDQWVNDNGELALRQRLESLALLNGPSGERYALFIGFKSLSEAQTELRKQIRETTKGVA